MPTAHRKRCAIHSQSRRQLPGFGQRMRRSAETPLRPQGVEIVPRLSGSSPENRIRFSPSSVLVLARSCKLLSQRPQLRIATGLHPVNRLGHSRFVSPAYSTRIKRAIADLPLSHWADWQPAFLFPGLTHLPQLVSDCRLDLGLAERIFT